MSARVVALTTGSRRVSAAFVATSDRRWLVRAPTLPLLLVCLIGRLLGAEILPPSPADHFNDYAGIVAPDFARQLNQELTEFERETTNQIVVAIFPRMQSDSSIEDYTVRVAEAWQVGTKEKRNGAVLFIFSEDRKLFIQVGYGLEGVLPDARCRQIIANEITPRFREGDFTGGVSAGVRAMLAAARGEYTGSGTTVRDREQTGSRGGGIGGLALLVIFLFLAGQSMFGRRRNVLYGRGGRRGVWMAPTWGGTPGGWGGGGGWSGGGGGGGSFSGGGGSFGGGGAGGNW